MPSKHYKPDSAREWRGRSYKKGGSRIEDLRAAVETLDCLIDGEPDDDGLGSALAPIRDLLTDTRVRWHAGPDDDRLGLDLATEHSALLAFVRLTAGAVGLHVGHPLDAIAFAVLARLQNRPPSEEELRDLNEMHAYEQGGADRTPHGE